MTMATVISQMACATPTQTTGPFTLDQAIQAAKADASRRTGTDVQALRVAGAENVTWRDGSLGCPDADRMYTQALVPGFRVRLESGGQVLDYHLSARGALLLCPAGRAQDPLPGAARI